MSGADADQSSTAVKSGQKLLVNGAAVTITAYNIGGNNFFKLRELGAAVGFLAAYDSAANKILLTSYNDSAAALRAFDPQRPQV